MFAKVINQVYTIQDNYKFWNLLNLFSGIMKI